MIYLGMNKLLELLLVNSQVSELTIPRARAPRTAQGIRTEQEPFLTLNYFLNNLSKSSEPKQKRELRIIHGTTACSMLN